MSNAATAELYFIAAMMILILLMSGVATYLFFRQYNLEKKNKEKINEQARRLQHNREEQKKEYAEK
jgi:Na+/melibiose symporter-like transporter